MELYTTTILSRLLSIIIIVGGLYVFYLIISKTAAKNMEKAKDAYICPKCGSLRLEITDKLPTITKFIGSVPAHNFLCHDCNYEGIAPKIDKVNINGFRKELKKK